MAGFVAGHLVDGVVDGVQVECLGALGQVGLAGGGAVLGLDPHLQVLFGGVGDDLTQKLGELGSVLRLFVGGLFPVQADLGIALPVGHTGHGQVHANLGALAVEVGAQILHDVLGSTLGHAHHVLSGPTHLGALLHELAAGGLALGTFLRGLVAFMDITANAANILAHIETTS